MCKVRPSIWGFKLQGCTARYEQTVMSSWSQDWRAGQFMFPGKVNQGVLCIAVPTSNAGELVENTTAYE